MASEISICNQAISWLGGNLIISLADGTTEANLCAANYEHLRDAVMEEGKWTFATRRIQLVETAENPTFGYENSYQIPPDVLSIIFATQYQDNKNDTGELDWRREEDQILCDADQIFVKCIIRITDPSKFSSMFNQALAARIAADIATALTESTVKEQSMWDKYFALVGAGLASDGLQGKSDRIKTNSRIVRNR